MARVKNLLGVLFLVGALTAVNFQAITYPFQRAHEFPFILTHCFVSFILFLVLQFNCQRLTAFTGALVFAFYPGHALALACGRYDWWMALNYIFILMASVAFAFIFERLLYFLKSQEKLVRDLFKIAVAALIIGMGIFSVGINTAFKNEESLWRFRVAHGGSAFELTQLADILRRKPGQAAAEVVSLYTRAIDKDKRYANAYFHLSDFYRSILNDKEAIAVLKRLIQADPSQTQAYFDLAGLYQAAADATKAIEIYNALLKIDPDNERNYVRVIEAYGDAIAKYPQETIYQEKREELLAEYEQFSKRKTYTAADYYNLGFLYQQVGGDEEAMRFYRKALALDPKHEKSMYSLANLYQMSGDVKSALALYARLVGINPKSILAYLNMGIIYNAMGDTVRAKILYQKVISIDPNNADAYFNLGYLSETAGELREAINMYEKAVENNPHHAEAYYNMGNVYASLDQWPEAIAAYLKTVAINPNHQNAFVNLSILSFKAKDFQGAIKYLDQAMHLGYTPPDAYLKTLDAYRKK